MAEAYITGLVLYDSRLFNRNSHVGRWAMSVSRTYTANAIARAPVNKRARKSSWYSAFPVGSLKASISGDADRIGPKHWQIVVSVDVPYAGYVLGGTKAIVPTSADYLTLPLNPGFGRRRRHNVVRGQRKNNFLAKAARPTARRHPSLRGLDSMLFQQW